MKKKQKVLKRLFKQKSSIQKVLNMLNVDEIAQFFIDNYDHSQGLQEVDPEFLEIVMSNLMANDKQMSQPEQSTIKIDVLTLGEAQLLAFCREKGLVNFFDYLGAIRYKRYKSHSYYGYMLVNNYPKQFQIGKRCTHYHCKTTARNIQKEYGIFNIYDDENDNADNQSRHQSDSNFIVNDDDVSEESQEIVMKKKTKEKKKQKQSSQQKLSSQKKKKTGMKNALNSQSEEEHNKQRQGKSVNKKSNKMNLDQQENSEQDHFLYKVLQNLTQTQILKNLNYSTMFEFLSEKDINKLLPILDQISETVLFNQKKTKRQGKKPQNHKKRLAKSKVNLKQLSLEDLLIECQKHRIIKEDDLNQWERKFELEDHPKLAHKLLKKFPNAFVLQGEFTGSTENHINTFVEAVYQSYQHPQNEAEQNNLSDFINDDEESEEMGSQQFSNDSDEESNYSIDPQEQKLGDIS